MKELPSEKSMWHKVCIEEICPYDNSCLKKLKTSILENGIDHIDSFQCPTCKKKFKNTIRIRDKFYAEVVEL